MESTAATLQSAGEAIIAAPATAGVTIAQSAARRLKPAATAHLRQCKPALFRALVLQQALDAWEEKHGLK